VEWKSNMEKSTGRKIKILRSDNRGEEQAILSYSYVVMKA